MKLEDAIRLGKECGLERIEECVNNVLAHATQLFHWPEMKREIDELIEEAKRAGVKFCPECGMAMVDGKCYVCKGRKNEGNF